MAAIEAMVILTMVLPITIEISNCLGVSMSFPTARSVLDKEFRK
jgi:hypothetical protein